jgi:hypothetical protein
LETSAEPAKLAMAFREAFAGAGIRAEPGESRANA